MNASPLAYAHTSSANPTLLGLWTVIYAAPDLEEATSWYASWLGTQPSFEETHYVSFNVGEFELGLDPDAKPAAGATAYWGVPHMHQAIEWAMAHGAGLAKAVQDLGGIKLCTIKDPFGNHVGLIENSGMRRAA